jgi:hypothetical protein
VPIIATDVASRVIANLDKEMEAHIARDHNDSKGGAHDDCPICRVFIHRIESVDLDAEASRVLAVLARVTDSVKQRRRGKAS